MRINNEINYKFTVLDCMQICQKYKNFNKYIIKSLLN